MRLFFHEREVFLLVLFHYHPSQRTILLPKKQVEAAELVELNTELVEQVT